MGIFFAGMKFAISSCWNSHRHEDGYAMVRELADLGFSHIELSHGVRLSLIPGILRALEEGVAQVSSVHNFCPLPVGVMGAAPNLYEPSAVSRRERILWLHNTRKTVEFAGRVGCSHVVLHSGRARFLFRDPEKSLERVSAQGAFKGQALQAVLTKGLKRIRHRQKGFIKRLKESYGLIAGQAREEGIRFGIENREGFTELPLDDEMPGLLESLAEHEVFDYWHDAGHAQLKERRGLMGHRELLEMMRPRLGGFHLHDVSEEERDHQVPGKGVIDWAMVSSFVCPGDCVVMEMSPRLSSEELSEGRDFLLRKIPLLAQ